MKKGDVNRLIDAIYDGGATRRDIARGMAALGLTTLATPLLPKVAKADVDDLVYMTWDYYAIPELHPGFHEKHGKSPAMPLFASEAEAFQKLTSGQEAQLAHAGTYDLAKWSAADLLRPIDTSRLSNWPDLIPWLSSHESINWDGQTWLAPFDWGATSIVYRTDKISVPPDEVSWSMLFDQEYAGKVSYQDDAFSVVIAGVATGAENPFQMTDSELAKVKEVMSAQHPNVLFYWTNMQEVQQGIASEEIWLSSAWNDGYLGLVREGIPVAWANPIEGAQTWCGGIARVNTKDGDEDLQYEFIDAMLSPEAARVIVQEYGFGHSNRKGLELAPDDVLATLGGGEAEVYLQSGNFFQPLVPPWEGSYVQTLNDIKLGF